jgi:carbon-monoxide dehydrogenase medium subunit
MKPAPFEYARPETLEDALKLLSDGTPETKVLAGGQSLVPMMNFRMARPERLIDINRIGGLDYVRIDGGELVIGALVRHATLRDSALVRQACPLMADAYLHVGHGVIRNRGTLCGNLCHADPASEMPAVMVASDAVMVLKSAGGERRVPARDFFLGTYETAAEEHEMLAEVRVPVAPKGSGWSFQEVSVRKGDFALAGVGATAQLDQGRISRVAIAACGVGDRAVRLEAAERSLIGKAPSAELSREAGQIAAGEVDPQSDVNADEAYRLDLVRTLVRRTVDEAISRAS